MMAVGDITLVEVQKALDSTPANTSLANTSASYTTVITSIILAGTSGSTKRTVTIHKNGTATGNIIMTIDIDPSGATAPKTVVLDSQSIILTGTNAIYVQQDTGTDVNVLISAVKEQVA